MMTAFETLMTIRPAVALAGLLMLVLGGCQQAAPPTFQPTAEPWTVLERIGTVRVGAKGDRRSLDVRPGDKMVRGSWITTGTGALLILARGGMQLTVSEETSLILKGADASAPLIEKGWVRLRQQDRAGNDAAIATPHVEVKSASAVLNIEVVDAKTGITVDQGSATVLLADGRHRTMTAGASTSFDRRPESPSMAGTTMAPHAAAPDLTANRRHDGAGLVAPSPVSPTPLAAMPNVKPASPTVGAGSAGPDVAETTADPPVARRRDEATSVLPLPASLVPASTPKMRPAFVAVGNSLPRPDTAIAIKRSSRLRAPKMPSIAMTTVEASDGAQAAALPASPRRIVDPVQDNFDRLTEGLVEDLPTVRSGTRRN